MEHAPEIPALGGAPVAVERLLKIPRHDGPGLVETSHHADGLHVPGLRGTLVSASAAAGSPPRRPCHRATCGRSCTYPVQAAISGQPKPVGGHGLVARHAPAVLVAASHHVDGHEVIGLRGAFEPAQRGLGIARHAMTVEQHLAQDGLGLQQPQVGGGLDPGGVGLWWTGAQRGQLLGRGGGDVCRGDGFHVGREGSGGKTDGERCV